MDWIMQPWSWYVSGAAIALVLLLLLLAGKFFGMSANLRTFCAMGGAGKTSEFFRYNWKGQGWNLMMVLGAVIGGYIAANYLTTDPSVAINPDTVTELKALGFESAGAEYLPDRFYGDAVWSDFPTLALLALGGLLVGFGARYAGGCTSGHAISGLSNLQWPSLVAVIGFFAGGMVMIYFLFPLIFG